MLSLSPHPGRGELIPPEALEPIRREFRVPHRVRDVLVPEAALQRRDLQAIRAHEQELPRLHSRYVDLQREHEAAYDGAGDAQDVPATLASPKT